MNDDWRKLASYILSFIAIMGTIALVALMIGQPPTHIPPPMYASLPDSTEPPTHGAIMSFVYLVAIVSIGVALWCTPLSFRSRRCWLHLGLTSCMTPAALNALLLWKAHADWVVATMWLFHNEPIIYWAGCAIVWVGSIWILVSLFYLSMAGCRLCARALRVIQR